MTQGSCSTGRRVLVIGLDPRVNRSVVEPLLEMGMDATGCVDPDHADQLFNARDFDLIALGSGIVAGHGERLRSAFHEQNLTTPIINVTGPVAVGQITAALQHDTQRDSSPDKEPQA